MYMYVCMLSEEPKVIQSNHMVINSHGHVRYHSDTACVDDRKWKLIN